MSLRLVFLAVCVVNSAVKGERVSWGKPNSCGNGLVCDRSQECVTHAPGAGLRYACAPKSAVVCEQDKRFFCPAHHECDTAAQRCKSESGSETMSRTANAHAMLSLDMNFCSVVRMRLPSFCACQAQAEGFKVECKFGLAEDRFDVKVDAKVCAKPARMDIEFAETNHNFHYELSVDGNVTGVYPVPYANITLPDVLEAKMYADVDLELNAAELDAKISLDICGRVRGGEAFCGHDLTPLMPLQIIDQTWHYSRFCRPETI